MGVHHGGWLLPWREPATLVGPQVGLAVDRSHPGAVDEEGAVVELPGAGDLSEAAGNDQIVAGRQLCDGLQGRPVDAFGQGSRLLD